MPIYEYECSDCGARFDKFVRSLSRQTDVTCPECKSDNCRKIVSSFSSGGSSSGGASCSPSGG